MIHRSFSYVIVALAFGLASCVPWTVRPIDDDKNAATVVSPASYVDSIWASKLLPNVLQSVVDARTLLDALAQSTQDAQVRYGHREANGPAYFLVRGEGNVTAVDTQSRVGFAFVDIAPFDRKADISIQIGPVLRGTSLRDATGLVRFTDFLNQLQFADVGNELNDRVLKTVLAGVDRSKLRGSRISFAGTLAAESKADPPLRELVPVRLTLEGQP